MNDDEDLIYVRGTLPRAVLDIGAALGPGGARNNDGTVHKMVDNLEYDTNESSDGNDNTVELLAAAAVGGAIVGGAVIAGGRLAWRSRSRIAARLVDPITDLTQRLRDQRADKPDEVGTENGTSWPQLQLEAPTERLDLDAVLGNREPSGHRTIGATAEEDEK